MDLSIIIPCYNEIDNVPKLKKELLPVLQSLGADMTLEVIFVDDGSTDDTRVGLQQAFMQPDIANFSVQIVPHETNLGLGQAMRTGFGEATGNIIITTDSDGTYQFVNIPKLLALLTDGIDIVTASPYHPAGSVVGVPAYRLILSKGSSAIYRVLVNRNIHTYTCLFRAYRKPVIQSINFSSNGFLAGTELLVKAMLKGYRVAEFPADLYRRSYGVSKAKLTRTILEHLNFQLNILLDHFQIVSLVTREKRQNKGWIRTRYSIE